MFRNFLLYTLRDVKRNHVKKYDWSFEHEAILCRFYVGIFVLISHCGIIAKSGSNLEIYDVMII